MGLLKKYEENSRRHAAHKATIDQLYDKYYDGSVDSEESFEDFTKRTEGIDMYDETDFAMMEWGISALFQPSVGDTGSIADTRRKVLDRLAESPFAQEAWEDVASRIETFEGDMHSEESKFPRAFTEAQQAFVNN